MPTQLSALDVTKRYAGRTVLDGVTCSLTAGERTGVVGENGSGKTTLLRLLAGRERPDQGEVIVRAEGGTGYLAQEERLPPRLTVQQVLDGSLGELRRVQERLRALEAVLSDGREPDATAALTEYGDLLTAFELRGGYDADARLERALHGLGLARLPRERAVGALSGGEQVRLRLASLLAAGPEVLLLDEPTNHLDDNALTWLEEHLRTRGGTTVAVSHDRVFLERVATSLLEVDADRHQVVRYGNGYPGYLAGKAAVRRRWALDHQRWCAETDRLREAVGTTARRVAHGRLRTDGNKMAYDRAGGRAQQSVASRVRNAEERLRRLLAQPVPPPPQPLRFTPPATVSGPVAGDAPGARAGGAVPEAGAARAEPAPALLEAGGVGVTGRLSPVALVVAAGERLLVTGENGAGKTTLLRVLAGDLEPDSGHLVRRGRVGHLPQEPAVGDPQRSLADAFGEGHPGTAEEHEQRLLALGLFHPELFGVPVGRLSTGQRQRLALARLLSEPADALLLDEPTNHLSPALVEEVEAALERYPGALVVVSHDRRLRQRWRGAHLVLRSDAAPGRGAGGRATRGGTSRRGSR